MTITDEIWAYLLNWIKPSSNEKTIKKALWAKNIIEKGYLTDHEYDTLIEAGYRPQ
jgi:hypothetical protein